MADFLLPPGHEAPSPSRPATPGKERDWSAKGCGFPDTFHFPFPLCRHFLHVGLFKRGEHFSENWRIAEKGAI
jgi:hypothetical protein